MTSTRSGLAVPDWPLSFGSLFPPMTGGVRFEHTHRLIASTVGLLTLILTIWIGKTEPRRWVRWLAIAAIGAVVAQGILGGMTVLHQLPAPVSIAHACLGPSFFSLIVALTVIHSPGWKMPQISLLNRLGIAVIFVQILLGAVVRHTSQTIWLHVGWAFGVLAVTGFVVSRSLSRTALLLGFLVVLEFFLGIGAFIFTRLEGVDSQAGRVLFPTIHQTLGALVLATAVALFLQKRQWPETS